MHFFLAESQVGYLTNQELKGKVTTKGQRCWNQFSYNSPGTGKFKGVN